MPEHRLIVFTIVVFLIKATPLQKKLKLTFKLKKFKIYLLHFLRTQHEVTPPFLKCSDFTVPCFIVFLVKLSLDSFPFALQHRRFLPMLEQQTFVHTAVSGQIPSGVGTKPKRSPFSFFLFFHSDCVV